jgi:hypothetical protein
MSKGSSYVQRSDVAAAETFAAMFCIRYDIFGFEAELDCRGLTAEGANVPTAVSCTRTRDLLI